MYILQEKAWEPPLDPEVEEESPQKPDKSDRGQDLSLITLPPMPSIDEAVNKR